jgi:thiol-disulfide isomerase/thioredoxin
MPGSYAPINLAEPPDDIGPSTSPPQSTRRRTAPSADRTPTPPSDADSAESADSPAGSGASNDPRRPTWRELSHAQPDVPVDESIRRASGDPGPNDHKVVTLTSAKSEPKPRLARLFGGSRPPVDPALQRTVCRFDPTERRLVDFQLPGLDGKMTSLHDIDADVILLDFWGSWCAPCRKSIPHLAEIQEKMGPKRLQVIGIACEKGASLADRQASAAQAIKELGISYPVLISNKDGSCPVQQALQVLFYPTMILIDREGRLLAREQGATDVTLARMDRAIAAALR